MGSYAIRVHRGQVDSIKSEREPRGSRSSFRTDLWRYFFISSFNRFSTKYSCSAFMRSLSSWM